MTETPAPTRESGWRRFWNRGGWWRAILLVALYYALYQLVGLVSGPLKGSGNPAIEIYVNYAIPIGLGCVILLVFALSMGWLRELFGPQPIRGRGWMWIAVVVVLLFNVLHFASIDYEEAGTGVVVAWLLSALFVGIAEETLTRGMVVNLMRKAGYREFIVALASATLFAAMHSGNIVTAGQSLQFTALQVAYTFGFGVCMYLTLRVTGNLIWPILLHASTDPSIFLQASYPAATPIAGLASIGNIAVFFLGTMLLFFIRGRVGETADAVPAPSASRLTS